MVGEISREPPPVWKQSYSKAILIKFDLAILDLGDSFFLQQKPKMAGRGPFITLQRPSLSSSFKIDGKICQRNLTRIDRTIQ